VIRFILIGILVLVIVGMLLRKKQPPPLLEEIAPIEPPKPRGSLPAAEDRDSDEVAH
jgi:hypothetical protein